MKKKEKNLKALENFLKKLISESDLKLPERKEKESHLQYIVKLFKLTAKCEGSSRVIYVIEEKAMVLKHEFFYIFSTLFQSDDEDEIELVNTCWQWFIIKNSRYIFEAFNACFEGLKFRLVLNDQGKKYYNEKVIQHLYFIYATLKHIRAENYQKKTHEIVEKIINLIDFCDEDHVKFQILLFLGKMGKAFDFLKNDILQFVFLYLTSKNLLLKESAYLCLYKLARHHKEEVTEIVNFFLRYEIYEEGEEIANLYLEKIKKYTKKQGYIS